MKTIFLITFLFAVLLCPAQAQVIPEASYAESALDGTFYTPGVVTGGQEGSTGIVDIIPGGDPYLSASGTTSAASAIGQSGGLGTAGGVAGLTYYLEIVPLAGGQSGITVPVDVVALGAAAASGQDPAGYSGSGEAGGLFTSPDGDAVGLSTLPGNLSLSFSYNQTQELHTGVLYSVSMSVNAQVIGEGNPAGEYAWAWIDPQISIDPSFAQANDYSLELSPNLVVPEPSTWAMLLGGLGLLAFWRQRKEKTGQA